MGLALSALRDSGPMLAPVKTAILLASPVRAALQQTVYLANFPILSLDLRV